jgi:hypothetical protein
MLADREQLHLAGFEAERHVLQARCRDAADHLELAFDVTGLGTIRLAQGFRKLVPANEGGVSLPGVPQLGLITHVAPVHSTHQRIGDPLG